MTGFVDDLAARVSLHLSAALGEPVGFTAADCVVSFDSGQGRLLRTVVLDLNDDGYFLTVIAQYESPSLAALAYRGEEDDNFIIVPA